MVGGGGGEKLKQGECGHRYTMPSYTIRSISLVLVGVKSAKAFYSLYFQVRGTKTENEKNRQLTELIRQLGKLVVLSRLRQV